jgi:hypothetical protein
MQGTAAANATACELAATGDLQRMKTLDHTSLYQADKHGALPIHWAAGSGHMAALRYLIDEIGMDAESEGQPPTKRAAQQSKRRRPLHYAARNGHLAIVRLLCEELGVDPDARARHSVSPFQLAVWQNQLDVATYLVEERGVDPMQVNCFACGAQHWLGTAPKERAGTDGESLIPMARWLRGHGLDWLAPQRQGHRPLHKASWGGHLQLCRWLRDECGALDDVQVAGRGFKQCRCKRRRRIWGRGGGQGCSQQQVWSRPAPWKQPAKRGAREPLCVCVWLHALPEGSSWL